MNMKCIYHDAERKFFSALNIITDHGTYDDQQKSMITLCEAEQAWGETVGPAVSITIQWGAKLQMGDCDTCRWASGHWVFIAHDFGEWLEIPIELSRKLHVEAEIEGKLFAPIHFADGRRYGANKKTRAPPSRVVVRQLAREIRLAEYNNACEIINQMGHVTTNPVGYELFSLRHDVCAGNHGRDYRGFYMCASDRLRDSGCALRVRDVISGKNETDSLQINAFVVEDQMHTGYIGLLAYGKHMYWAQQSEETTRPNWGKWDAHLSKHIRYFLQYVGMTCPRIILKWSDPLGSRSAKIATCVPNRLQPLMISTM